VPGKVARAPFGSGVPAGGATATEPSRPSQAVAAASPIEVEQPREACRTAALTSTTSTEATASPQDRAAHARRPWRERAACWAHGHRWLLVGLAAALILGELPLLLAACCAPPDARGLGNVWFINDFAQYESAMRQGARQPGWLIVDVFTAEPHRPAFMFPLYVAFGKLGATLGLQPIVVERLAEPLARLIMVVALWRFCHTFAAGRAAATAAFLLALLGSGFELFTGLLGPGALYAGNWSYETNTVGLLFAAPHVPLAMAATLELARLGLRPRAAPTHADVLVAAGLGAAIALLHPFHLPVLLAALLASGLLFLRRGRGVASLAVGSAACLGALPVIWPTLTTFSFDPFWLATYSVQNVLPSPAPHELIVELGPTLLLALGGALALRTRVAPAGLLLWLLGSLAAMYLPVPYQRRLGFGLQPQLAVLAGNTLLLAGSVWPARRAALLRLAVVAGAASGTSLVLLSIIVSGVRNSPLAVYRSTADLDAASAWLDSHAQPDETILADWSVANYLAPRTPARVFGGHPVATLDAAAKQQAVARTLAAPQPWRLAAQLGASWLVCGPEIPPAANAPPADFTSGAVRVYHLPTEPSR